MSVKHSMKESVKKVLKRFGIYDSLKYSDIFRVYERLFKPEAVAAHQREVDLYSGIIPTANLIFDIGAYDGHKTAAFMEIARKVVSCEPDPDSFNILKRRFGRRSDKVILLNYAIYNSQTELTLQRNYKGSAFNTVNPNWKDILEKDNGRRWDEVIRFDEAIEVRVTSVTLDDLIKRFGVPDLIKIDVEGSELEVLEGLNTPIKFVSFECLLPEFINQLIAIMERLRSLDPRYRFNVIYNEKLLFPYSVSHIEMLEWINKSNLNSFDTLAMLH